VQRGGAISLQEPYINSTIAIMCWRCWPVVPARRIAYHGGFVILPRGRDTMPVDRPHGCDWDSRLKRTRYLTRRPEPGGADQ